MKLKKIKARVSATCLPVDVFATELLSLVPGSCCVVAAASVVSSGAIASVVLLVVVVVVSTVDVSGCVVVSALVVTAGLKSVNDNRWSVIL